MKRNDNNVLIEKDFYKERRKKEARRHAWLKKERKKNKTYFFICSAVIICSIISMFGTKRKINAQERQLIDINIKIAEQIQANDVIEQTLTLPEEQLLEEYARENYGYLKPGEIVYYDVNAMD